MDQIESEARQSISGMSDWNFRGQSLDSREVDYEDDLDMECRLQRGS